MSDLAIEGLRYLSLGLLGLGLLMLAVAYLWIRLGLPDQKERAGLLSGFGFLAFLAGVVCMFAWSAVR
jgi:hypothetical protein